MSGSSASSSVSGDREHWSSHVEFFLTTLGLAVGLGNVWRFPYVTYTSGGGSFLIPYVSVLLMVAIPILFMEFTIGQYGKRGINKVRQLHFSPDLS